MLRWIAIIVLCVAATAIGVLAVLTPVGLLVKQHPAGTTDFVSAYVDSFEASKVRLANEQIVGYMTDKRVDTTRGGDRARRYYLTQYALAPVLIANGTRGYGLTIINYLPQQAKLLERMRRHPRIAALELIDVPGRAIAVRRKP
jgi:hypothetical protein